jgi:hypothetical protein
MLPVATTRVVGIFQMVFTNLITAIHGHMITSRPLISSVVVRGCKNADVLLSRGKY